MKLVAYYLPQFHTIPENDAWWGPGFTEWSNTRVTRPLWKGHYQPREPAADNYYDLTDPAARQRQADLARRHGIHAFCYYHYWFNGRRLLEKPLEAVLSSGEPAFPFCVAWANEPWTRAWDGGDREILMPQEYGDEPDWRRHYECLRRFFIDPRYLRHDGRPVLLIYRTGSIPCLEPMLRLWRGMACADGIGDLFVVAIMSLFMDRRRLPAAVDAYQEFEPHNALRWDLPRSTWLLRNLRHRARTRFGPYRWLMDRYSYDTVWESILRRDPPAADRPVIPGAFVDWDNTARKKTRAIVMDGMTPDKFGRYLARQIARARDVYRSDLLFVNAWNEWAEGTYLEPDKRYGDAVLRQVRAATETHGFTGDA